MPLTLALLNLALCAAVAWASMCRLNTTTHETRPEVRAQFVALLAGSLAHGLQPILWGWLPGWGSVMMSGAVLLFLLLGMRRWRNGAPPDTTSAQT